MVTFHQHFFVAVALAIGLRSSCAEVAPSVCFKKSVCVPQLDTGINLLLLVLYFQSCLQHYSMAF